MKRNGDVIGIHLIEKKDFNRATLIDPKKKIWETGSYIEGSVIHLKRASELKGCPIWLHKGKRIESHLGGRVIGYRIDELKGVRLFFIEKQECIGSLANVSWGHNTRVYIFGEQPLKEEFEEGRILLTLHKKNERNRTLINLLKILKQTEDNKLSCEACGFSFAEKYGERGNGYIEAHHLIPFKQLKGHRKSKVEDFAVVCSNCHRMLHRNPFMTIQELARVINAQNRQSK